jgi:FkbM family methyltransferase
MMGIKTKLLEYFAALLTAFVRLLAGRQASQALATLAERLAPVVAVDARIGQLRFFCPSRFPEWRARTLMTKEPETIQWIDGFEKADVLWDVGANVGVFALYAGLRGLSVVAFEPSPGNAYVLSRNIELNDFSERVSSYCIAFNDETRLDSFHMSSTELGTALSSFGEAVDWKGEAYAAKFEQAMLGFTIDDFIRQFNPPFPNHIKIDVDGIEMKIVRGADITLADKRVRSVLIELNIKLDDCQETIALMESYGFRLDKREHADEFFAGEENSVFNHIFVRKS